MCWYIFNNQFYSKKKKICFVVFAHVHGINTTALWPTSSYQHNTTEQNWKNMCTVYSYELVKASSSTTLN